jgi:phosphoribosyl-AMP cyclohydrolase
MTAFPALSDKHALEEGTEFAPRFDANGMITCVTTDAATGEAFYWSRSRQRLWHKGDTSGRIQTIVEMRIDCDQDALWLKVNVAGDGGCCHTGRHSCFYRVEPLREAAGAPLIHVCAGD